MKLLFIYLDAVRGDLSSFRNEEIERTLLEEFQKKIGGTYYKNAYAVAPETFRSFATIRTSLYPKKNGVNIPGNNLFLKNKIELFLYLLEKKYSIYALTAPLFEEGEIFNLKGIKRYYEFENLLKNYLEDKSENKVIFYYCFDYHELAVWENTFEQERRARNKLGSILFNTIDKIEEEFEKIILFSDHGYKMESEIKKPEDLSNLDDSKINVLLQIRENIKEKKKLEMKENVVSLLDIFPTVISWHENEEKYSLDGVSLLKSKERKLYLEDVAINVDQSYGNIKKLNKQYFVKVITDQEKKDFTLEELYKLKNTKFFEEVEKNLSHLEIFSQLYFMSIKSGISFNKGKTLDEMKISRYEKSEKRIKTIKYLDGTNILKEDFYRNQTRFKKKWIKGKKEDIINKMKETVKELIRLFLVYIGCYEICLKIKERKL